MSGYDNGSNEFVEAALGYREMIAKSKLALKALSEVKPGDLEKKEREVYDSAMRSLHAQLKGAVCDINGKKSTLNEAEKATFGAIQLELSDIADGVKKIGTSNGISIDDVVD